MTKEQNLIRLAKIYNKGRLYKRCKNLIDRAAKGSKSAFLEMQDLLIDTFYKEAISKKVS